MLTPCQGIVAKSRRDILNDSMSAVFLVLSAFLASAVEMVEALTIVLAAGLDARLALLPRGVGRRDRRRSRRRRRARPGADA